MSPEEIALLEAVLDVPPHQALMKRFGFKDRAELVAFLGVLAGLTLKLEESGQLPQSANLDELAGKIKDMVDMLRPIAQPPSDPSSPLPSDSGLN
jgi:hypothetical protein